MMSGSTRGAAKSLIIDPAPFQNVANQAYLKALIELNADHSDFLTMLTMVRGM
jgi:hypothetical protein